MNLQYFKTSHGDKRKLVIVVNDSEKYLLDIALYCTSR